MVGVVGSILCDVDEPAVFAYLLRLSNVRPHRRAARNSDRGAVGTCDLREVWSRHGRSWWQNCTRLHAVGLLLT